LTPEAPLFIPKIDELLMSKDFPTKGRIEFNDVNLRYREDTELVLKNLSVTIEPQEKVGIVGRTGSGKSTVF
jgi:ABC-type multidrug transport system fused ATPase/permease subunit